MTYLAKDFCILFIILMVFSLFIILYFHIKHKTWEINLFNFTGYKNRMEIEIEQATEIKNNIEEKSKK